MQVGDAHFWEGRGLIDSITPVAVFYKIGIQKA
jgi:hypothetical protein